MIPYNKYKKYKKIQQHQYYFDIKSKILHWVHKKKKKRKKRPIHSTIHLSNNGFYDNLNKSIDARKVWSEKQWWLYVTNIDNFLWNI